MLGFKDFDCARVIPRGIETMHTIKKWQMASANKTELSAVDPFQSLAL
jgi:putative transposase